MYNYAATSMMAKVEKDKAVERAKKKGYLLGLEHGRWVGRASVGPRPRVFFDITIGNEPVGRIVMEVHGFV